MKNLLKKIHDWGPALLMPLALALGFLIPGSAQAVVRLSTGDSIGEGDPVDGNDYGTDGGGGCDDNLQDNLGITSLSSWTLPALVMDGVRIIVVPDLRSGTVFFQVIIIEEACSLLEGIDAQ